MKLYFEAQPTTVACLQMLHDTSCKHPHWHSQLSHLQHSNKATNAAAAVAATCICCRCGTYRRRTCKLFCINNLAATFKTTPFVILCRGTGAMAGAALAAFARRILAGSHMDLQTLQQPVEIADIATMRQSHSCNCKQSLGWQ
jgi:hypothetical protein